MDVRRALTDKSEGAVEFKILRDKQEQTLKVQLEKGTGSWLLAPDDTDLAFRLAMIPLEIQMPDFKFAPMTMKMPAVNFKPIKIQIPKFEMTPLVLPRFKLAPMNLDIPQINIDPINIEIPQIKIDPVKIIVPRRIVL